ncbi:FG-GAP repeat domain-containing protein [Streptomyces sp. NPDC056480]|uniref:FG-GAP repeat domain-containing protein n=1 Tax=Streptomyces sp. NPDC056480 TaxID=3345833 RepID=UPI0036C50981
MSRAGTSRRRLAAAVTGALAVTAGTLTAVPAAAATGGTADLGVKDHALAPIPTVVDFSRGQDATLVWEFDAAAVIQVVLTHKASGKRWTAEPVHLDRPHVTGTTWTGMFDDMSSAFKGDYTWKMTARPLSGVGPAAERTGTLKVAGKAAPHDFSDSGVPDLLVKDSAGRLLNYDARQSLYMANIGYRRTPVVMGTGWQTYDRVAAPGNLDASPYADLVARDRTGALWLYSGTGRALAPRVRIGGGWQTYHQLTGGSDLTGDGRADLVATDKAGDLWLYKGTGNGTAPFAPRRKIGHGWGVYNKITATGNIGGGPAGDLVARDTAGVLWLYLGKGDGTFAARTRIGGGWDRYSDIVGVGDIDRNGTPDLVTHGVMGGSFETFAYYEGTGDGDTPFGPRRSVYSPDNVGTGTFTLF